MVQAAEAYETATTLKLEKGTSLAQYASKRPVDVKFDPVTNILFQSLMESRSSSSQNFALEIVKIPVDDFSVQLPAFTFEHQLKALGLNSLWEYFAVLLWHQDSEILQLGESALVITGVLEHAMMGRHIFAIANFGGVRRCDYVPIGLDEKVHLPYPVQWCVAAKKV